jgi:hypothetical protein
MYHVEHDLNRFNLIPKNRKSDEYNTEKWINNVQRLLYIYVVCAQRYITCHLSCISDKNVLKKQKRTLSELQDILEYLVILSRFFFSWLIRQDSFRLEFQTRIFFFPGKKNLVWTARNLKYLVILSRFFFSWLIRQDSFVLNFKQESSFFPVKKNLIWSQRLKRISSEIQEKQEPGKNDDKIVD